MIGPGPGHSLEELVRSRFAQAERLERELAVLREAWGPADHPLIQRWLAGEMSAGELRVFAGEHYHAVLALGEMARRAVRLADGMLAEQLQEYANAQERSLALWLRFAGAAGWRGSAWYFGEDPLAETVACVTSWSARSRSLAELLVTIWAVESALTPLSAAQGEALRADHGFTVQDTCHFVHRGRHGAKDAAVAQAGLTSLLPVAAPLTLVCHAELAHRSYLELLDGVVRYAAIG